MDVCLYICFEIIDSIQIINDQKQREGIWNINL